MFVKRYQKPGERMLEYATALNSLGMNAFPNLSLEHLDQYLVNQYLTGLQNTSAADCLSSLIFDNFEDLVIRARDIEIQVLNFTNEPNGKLFL